MPSNHRKEGGKGEGGEEEKLPTNDARTPDRFNSRIKSTQPKSSNHQSTHLGPRRDAGKPFASLEHSLLTAPPHTNARACALPSPHGSVPRLRTRSRLSRPTRRHNPRRSGRKSLRRRLCDRGRDSPVSPDSPRPPRPGTARIIARRVIP